MKRSLTLAALIAVSCSLPVLADDMAASRISASDSSAGTFTAHLSAHANADQARKLLLAQNYTKVSRLNLDRNGRWTGTAVKNGKKTIVTLYLPRRSSAVATN